MPTAHGEPYIAVGRLTSPVLQNALRSSSRSVHLPLALDSALVDIITVYLLWARVRPMCSTRCKFIQFIGSCEGLRLAQTRSSHDGKQFDRFKKKQADLGLWSTAVKARLHMRFFMRFRCNFDAIWRTKPPPAYPARVFSRVTLRQNTARLAEIRKKGVFK